MLDQDISFFNNEENKKQDFAILNGAFMKWERAEQLLFASCGRMSKLDLQLKMCQWIADGTWSSVNFDFNKKDRGGMLFDEWCELMSLLYETMYNTQSPYTRLKKIRKNTNNSSIISGAEYIWITIDEESQEPIFYKIKILEVNPEKESVIAETLFGKVDISFSRLGYVPMADNVPGALLEISKIPKEIFEFFMENEEVK